LVASRPLAQKESIITRHTVEDAKRRLKILLVEDNVVNQKLAAKMLENRGHHVHIASNGQKAIDALTRECYDLVLMDIQMPEMDGLEATGRIREREKQEGSHIPIVAMTAHAMKGDKERCLAAGMDDYLSKPIIASDLFDMIDRWGERIRRISKRRSSFHS
jgi:CheY-like chemotaxis protein